MDDLPHNLKIELSLYIHEQTYKNIYFIKEKSMAFISWICPLLKAYPVEQDAFVYFEGDEVVNVFFMKEGQCGFVLPKFNNTKYISISNGCDFGTEDIIGCMLRDEFNGGDWIQQRDRIIRQFTVKADRRTELLLLSITDLNRMQHEFLEAYNMLMEVAC